MPKIEVLYLFYKITPRDHKMQIFGKIFEYWKAGAGNLIFRFRKLFIIKIDSYP